MLTTEVRDMLQRYADARFAGVIPPSLRHRCIEVDSIIIAATGIVVNHGARLQSIEVVASIIQRWEADQVDTGSGPYPAREA